LRVSPQRVVLDFFVGDSHKKGTLLIVCSRIFKADLLVSTSQLHLKPKNPTFSQDSFANIPAELIGDIENATCVGLSQLGMRLVFFNQEYGNENAQTTKYRTVAA